MGFNCGIVGLPNVGKSTIFNALTNGKAASANYPFCTIDPNTGVVPVRDPRLYKLAEISTSKKTLPTLMEFVDIAGLVKGASTGEGLGNQFLSHIRAVDAIAHVVRCFDDADVVHVHGRIDPVDDIAVITTELVLADLEQAEKRLERIKKGARSHQKELLPECEALEKLLPTLQAGNTARTADLTEKEWDAVKGLHFLTQKPLLYVANLDENEYKDPSASASYQALCKFAATEGAIVVPICGKLESELAELSEDDRAQFLADLGMTESGLDRLAHEGYRLLGLLTYFTTGPQETRAWTITKGTAAPAAAGKIHSDLERGFICAEVYPCTALFEHGSEAKLKAAGLIRQEGKDYLVQDGDTMFIKFNV